MPSARPSRPPSTPLCAPQKAKAGGGAAKGRPKAGSGGGGGGGAAKKGAKGKNGAAGGGGKGDGEAAVKKTRKPSTVMWRVSDELAAVVGSSEATVDTIRSGVYGYIKEHKLQVCTYVRPFGRSHGAWWCAGTTLYTGTTQV